MSTPLIGYIYNLFFSRSRKPSDEGGIKDFVMIWCMCRETVCRCSGLEINSLMRKDLFELSVKERIGKYHVSSVCVHRKV